MALHITALNGYANCVQLLLDLHADVAAVTFHCGPTMNLIGMFSTLFCESHRWPADHSMLGLSFANLLCVVGVGSAHLHYASCGGNLRCCQANLNPKSVFLVFC